LLVGIRCIILRPGQTGIPQRSGRRQRKEDRRRRIVQITACFIPASMLSAYVQSASVL
jgi:hypothetical protein